jgi:hypothetical protein
MLFIVISVLIAFIIGYIAYHKRNPPSFFNSKWDGVRNRKPSETDSEWGRRISVAVGGTVRPDSYYGVLSGKSSLPYEIAVGFCFDACDKQTATELCGICSDLKNEVLSVATKRLFV